MVYEDTIEFFVDGLHSLGHDANVLVEVLDEDSVLSMEVFEMCPRPGVQTLGVFPRLGVHGVCASADRCDVGAKILPHRIEVTLQLWLHRPPPPEVGFVA